MQKINTRRGKSFFDWFVVITVILILMSTAIIITSNGIKTKNDVSKSINSSSIVSMPGINPTSKPSPPDDDGPPPPPDDDDDDGGGGGGTINARPVATIDVISPNPAQEFQTVSFSGHGNDSDGTIIGYWWNIDDTLVSNDSSFSVNNLTPGIHKIMFWVKDNQKKWSDPVNQTLQIIMNMPPSTPTITAKPKSPVKEPCTITVNAIDPNNNQVYYMVDWGDGTAINWDGPYTSGLNTSFEHLYEKQGSYVVQVKAKDKYGLESEWATIKISMPSFQGSFFNAIMKIISHSYLTNSEKITKPTYMPNPNDPDDDDDDGGGGEGGTTNARPVATIDVISPNPAQEFQTVSFSGHGNDSDGTIVGYWWEADDLLINTNNTFTLNSLSPGVHTIKFFVQDNQEKWSHSTNKTLAIIENKAPLTPIITGNVEGTLKKPYEISVISSDPNGNQIFYMVDWGDNTTTEWQGPYVSEQNISYSHQYDKKETYLIKVKAKDPYGLESDWATLTVTMPYSYDKPIPQFLEWLFQRFPHAFPILRHLLGY